MAEGWPLLSLDNFDAPENSHSRYILTSPVSLRPLELLPKSFSDFRLSFNETELPKLQEAYAEYELQRRSKLATARRLRERMKNIEKGLPWQHDSAAMAMPALSSSMVPGERGGRSRSGGGVIFSLSPLPTTSRDCVSAGSVGIRENSASKKSPRRSVHSRRPSSNLKAKSKISEDINGGQGQMQTPMASGGTRNLSPHLPSHRRSKVKSGCHAKKDIERRDVFQKQVKERLQALDSIKEYVYSEKKEKIEARHKRAELHRELQSRLKEQKMKEKFLHEELKKKCQKLNIQHLEDQEFIRRQVVNKQREEMETLAAKKRLILTRQKVEGAMRRNQEKRAQFERNRLHQELHNTVEKHCMEEEMRKRQQLAQERLQLEKSAREARIQDIVELRGQRSQQCRLTAQCIEQSLQKWREEVDHRQMAATRSAQQAVQKSVEKKRTRASQTSEERRREHAVNIAKLAEKHKEKTESYQQNVEQWQRDRLELSRKKQVEADKRYAIVSCSSMFRSMLKDEESFAAKCKVAEDRARLENAHFRNRARNSLSWSIK